MRNIEIKARVGDIEKAEAVAREVAQGDCVRLVQRDTYFRAPEGRLKLREVTGDRSFAELIFYRRPDESGPKRCEYEIAPVDDAAELKRTLAAALEVAHVVEKERTVYMHRPPTSPGVEHVRIHLDRVKGLGEFIEFEAVMREGAQDAEGKALLRDLMARFGVSEADLVEGSYCDLIGHASDRSGGHP